MSTTRRTFLAGLAALPAAPALASVTPPDPTFALIKAHRAAWAAFGTIVDDDAWNGLGAAPSDVQALYRAEIEAMEALLTPMPTTLAGLRALAEHMLWYDAKLEGEIYADQPTRWALATLAEACRLLIAEGGA